MSDAVVVDVSRLGPRRGVRTAPKGRRVDPRALAEVRALLGDTPRRRDLLIEYLHKLNDTYRCLHDRHIVALARVINVPMAEIYEVATFYHHFEVVKEGETPPPPTTIRVPGAIFQRPGSCSSAWSIPAQTVGTPADNVTCSD